MRVLYIHQYFTTHAGTVGTRSYEFARALLSRGHQVTMICGSDKRVDTGLDGAFTFGQRTGEVDGIDVVEFEVRSSNHDPLMRRAIKFASFGVRSTMAALRRDYDVIFTTSTPLTAALPGAAAAVFRRKPFVFEVRDLWPELPIAMGLGNPLAIAAMTVLEWLGYRAATSLVALAPGIADGIARHGVARDRIVTIPNGCDLKVFASAPRIAPASFRPERFAANDFVAVFAGAHGLANGLDAVLDAATVLQARGRTDIKILLIGEGSQKPALVGQAQARRLTNVVFEPAIPKLELAGLLKGADIGLQILADLPAFYRGTSPNKFFDYLAAGRPVLINYPGWLAELVQAEGCGFAVHPGNPGAFADALIEAADDRAALAAMGEKSLALGQRSFDRALLADRFVQTLEKVAKPASHSVETPKTADQIT